MDEFEIRPITSGCLDHINSKCWDNRETQLRLIDAQEILGFGAWNTSDNCIAQLHCYSVMLPDWDDCNFPYYARKRLQDCPLGWPLLSALSKNISYDNPVWLLSCFHVGLLQGTSDSDPRYYNKGIGKALLTASVRWAEEHGYSAVLGHGGSGILPMYNIWMGSLPWTAYKAVGFDALALEEDGLRLPWWKDMNPDLVRQINSAMLSGHDLKEICARCMILEFNK